MSAVDANRMVGVRGVELTELMECTMSLHARTRNNWSMAEFEELPDHADGHGEAEGHDRQNTGAKARTYPVGPVEQGADQREAGSRSEEAVLSYATPRVPRARKDPHRARHDPRQESQPRHTNTSHDDLRSTEGSSMRNCTWMNLLAPTAAATLRMHRDTFS